MLQMVEQPVEVLSFLRSSVPALSLPVCAVQRVVPLKPLRAEQFVDVPTSLCIFEPRGRGARGDLQGSLQVRVCCVLWSRTLTLQFQVVLLEVFLVFSQDRVQQSLLPRVLTFWLVVVFTVYAQDRFQRRFLELNMSMQVQFPVKVLIMDLFEALLQDRVQELVVDLMSVVEVVRAPSQDGV